MGFTHEGESRVGHFLKGKRDRLWLQLEQRRGAGDMMQPRSSIAAPQRNSSESLFEETELGLSSRWGGGEKSQ